MDWHHIPLPGKSNFSYEFEEFETREKTVFPNKMSELGVSSLVVVVPTQPLSQIEWSVSATT